MEFIAANRACGVEPLTNHIAYNFKHVQLIKFSDIDKSIKFHFGWGKRNRTSILGTKNPCLAVRRYPNLVGVAGFEPATYRSQSGRATNCAILRYGGDKRSRTFDTRIFSPLLYRLSYVSKYGTRWMIRTSMSSFGDYQPTVG